MHRRFFAKNIFLSVTGLTFTPELKFLQINKEQVNLPNDTNLEKSLVYIHNGNLLSTLNEQELIALYINLNKKNFPSDFIPYNPTNKLTQDDINQLWQNKYTQVETEHEGSIKEISDIISYGSATGSAFEVAAVVTIPFSPPASLVLGTMGLITSAASNITGAFLSSYANKSTNSRILQAAKFDFNNYVFLYGLDFEMPDYLKNNVADTTNIKSKIENNSFLPQISKKLSEPLLKSLRDPLAPIPPDLLEIAVEETSIFKNSPSNERTSATEPLTEQQIKEELALAQNLHALGSILISRFAGETEGKVLNAILNAGMQYLSLSLSSLGMATLGAVGWTAIGVSLATSLIENSNKGGSFEGAVMKAFEMVFKELQEIRKSILEIQQRQIDMLLQLDDIVNLLHEQKKDIKHIKSTLEEIVRLEDFIYNIALERSKGEEEGKGIEMPMNKIDTLAAVVYKIDEGILRDQELLNQKEPIRSAFNSIANYAFITTRLIEYNGTREVDPLTFENPRNMKYRIFDPLFDPTNPSSSLQSTIYRINLYDNIGIISYIYRFYLDNDINITESIRNTKALNKAISNYITAQVIFPQEIIRLNSERKIEASKLFKMTEKTNKELKQMVSKNNLQILSTIYLKEAKNLFYSTGMNIHLFVQQNLANQPLINTEGKDANHRALVNNVSQLFHLRTTGSNYKSRDSFYHPYSMPFRGAEPMVHRDGVRTAGYPSLGEAKILRDNFATGYQSGRSSNDFYSKDNVSRHENPYFYSLLDLIYTFDFAKLTIRESFIQSHKYVERGMFNNGHHYVKMRGTILSVGAPFELKVYELEFYNLPLLTGIKIFFTEARMISSMVTFSGYYIITGFYSELAFCSTPGFFENYFTLTWKEEIKQQLKAAGRENELQGIPKFDSFSIKEFIIFLIDKKILDLKNGIISNLSRAIADNFVNKHKLDHIAPSLYITSRLNCTIASNGIIPFEIDYTGQVFRLEDLQIALQRLYSFETLKKIDEQLYQFLEKVESKETADIQLDFNTFDFNKSVFYYQQNASIPNINPVPYSKLDLNNFYDFLLIYLRHKIIETATSVETSITELKENHAEPYLADTMIMLDGYMNLLPA